MSTVAALAARAEAAFNATGRMPPPMVPSEWAIAPSGTYGGMGPGVSPETATPNVAAHCDSFCRKGRRQARKQLAEAVLAAETSMEAERRARRRTRRLSAIGEQSALPKASPMGCLLPSQVREPG